ncbi:MAG TPA: response regulator [Jatrophihabitantaceae bacterium]
MDRNITAIASLLWPLLVLAALIVFRPALVKLLDSAKDREWTIEIAGQKLSMGQVREQQTKLISDLQRQLGTMRQQLDALSASRYLEPLDVPLSPSAPAAEAEPADLDDLDDLDEPVGPGLEWREYAPSPWSGPPSAPGSAPAASGGGLPPQPQPQAYQPSYGPPGTGVLWVDDHPENNAILADSLLSDGVPVDTAVSTDEALARLRKHRYAAVISDMDRVERGTDVPDAGMQLLDAVHGTDPALPVVIYCGERNALAYRDRALAAGARAITDSSAEVVTQLQRLDVV